VALVTGAASGIGQATALLLAREGARVAVADRNETGAAATARELLTAQHKALTYPLDVTSEADWQATISSMMDIWGQIDILVNSAGVSFGKPITDMTLDEWRMVMAVNLDGIFLGTKHTIPAMRTNGGGSIVNISSASGLKAVPVASAYVASKAAVRYFSKSAALECAQNGDNIRVNCVLPGGVATPMWESMDFWHDLVAETSSTEAAWAALASDVPLKRFAQPVEVAQAVLYLASDAAQFVTGAELVIDGGYTA
jgi:NAD(P)-dependent dehydrogenase (short-subunit alcohol dehydrogenase family)